MPFKAATSHGFAHLLANDTQDPFCIPFNPPETSSMRGLICSLCLFVAEISLILNMHNPENSWHS